MEAIKSILILGGGAIIAFICLFILMRFIQWVISQRTSEVNNG